MTSPVCGKCGEPMSSENSVLEWGVEFHSRCFRGQQPAIGATAPPPPEETPWESEKRYAREHSGGTGEAITPPAPAAPPDHAWFPGDKCGETPAPVAAGERVWMCPHDDRLKRDRCCGECQPYVPARLLDEAEKNYLHYRREFGRMCDAYNKVEAELEQERERSARIADEFRTYRAKNSYMRAQDETAQEIAAKIREGK